MIPPPRVMADPRRGGRRLEDLPPALLRYLAATGDLSALDVANLARTNRRLRDTLAGAGGGAPAVQDEDAMEVMEAQMAGLKLDDLPVEVLQEIVFHSGSFTAAGVGRMRQVNKWMNWALSGRLEDGYACRILGWDAAVARGTVHCVRHFVERDRVDPSRNHNAAIGVAVENGLVDLVEYLLSDDRVRLSVDVPHLLVLAAWYNQVGVLRALLVANFPPPLMGLTEALGGAAARDNVEPVRVLLEDGRADPTAANSNRLRIASRDGLLSIVREFLRDGRADPRANDSEALREAVNHGHVEIVRDLLVDGRADPAAQGNYALIEAVTDGRLDIVQLLLRDGRVDASANNYEAIAVSHEEYPDLGMTIPLLRSLRVGTRVHDEWIRAFAVANRYRINSIFTD